MIVIFDSKFGEVSHINCSLEEFRTHYAQKVGSNILHDDEAFNEALYDDGLTLLEVDNINPVSIEEYFLSGEHP